MLRFFLPLLLGCVLNFFLFAPLQAAPEKIAIANYGAHASLLDIIAAFKRHMAELGYIEGEQVEYIEQHVNFDNALIPAMLTKLVAEKPRLILALSTPVAQVSVHQARGIPVVFGAITDPVQAGFVAPTATMTGVSDRQDIPAVLAFIRQLVPHVKRMGLLYAPSQPNDIALLKMMERAASEEGMTLEAVPVDQARDVPVRIQKLQGKVDVIYVGPSGPIQPALPAIAAAAKQMQVPVVNFDADAVRQRQVVASYAVNYQTLGARTAETVVKILQGASPIEIPFYYPQAADHHATIHRALLQAFGLDIPATLASATVIEE